MGNIFSVPVVRSEDLHADLRRLRERWGVELIATVVDEKAESLATARRPRRVALLLGNEAQGLSEDDVRLCDRRVTIPMARGTDSVNVSVAAGIFLYHFTQYAKS
jgi:tRNA G18 (ribose-2'-O)-methylase SpoU